MITPDIDNVIQIDAISKLYKLGTVGRGSVQDDIKGWWAKFRKQEDPFQKIGEKNIQTISGESKYIWALKDINLNIKKGEILGIIGKNGAGKSTLLKILSRITSPTKGSVKIRGRTASLLEVGTGFHPELTGRENIFLNGAILGMTKTEINNKLDQIVDFSGIERFINTPVKKYSSGMYVRLAFAVAAHLEPEILIVDEVLAVGDQSFQDKCLGKMQSVSKSGRTILFVSHNLHAVRKLCQRGILLENGMMIMEGDIDQVLTSYTQKKHKQAPKVDLPTAENSEPIFGKRLQFFNKMGEFQTTFLLREEWKVRLEFELIERLPHVIAAIGLVTTTDISIITYWSEPEDLEPGIYYIDYEINKQLSACQLNFIVGLSSREVPLYYKENLGYVTISEMADGPQPYQASGSGILLSEDRTIIKRFN